MKVALVYSFEESSWFSCTIIVKNLLASYERVFGKENITHINYSHNRHVASSDIEVLAKSDISKVIFIDHKPTPVNFLIKLAAAEKNISTEREFIIHVFGDFPLYLVEWRTVFEKLKGRSAKFICASQKQRNFIRKFFKQDEIQFVSPFPVQLDSFYHSDKARKSKREELGLSKEKVFIYTGRLSLQKRITELIELFGEALRTKRIESNSKLLIVGKTDELGVPYLDHNLICGEYFRSIDKAIIELGEFADNIICTGVINNKELVNYYNAADHYLSLSTYHDEDYGMSVAEALCCGLPATITNWAGYRSFQLEGHEQFCQLVPVELSEYLPKIDSDCFLNLLSKTKDLNIDRSEMSKVYTEHFSVASCADNLRSISEAKVEFFSESSEAMVSLTNEQFLRGNLIFKQQDSKKYNKRYFEVYDVYSE